MLFRLLIFIMLVLIGYRLSQKLRPSKVSTGLVGTFLVIVMVGFILLSKRVFDLFGYSFYFVIILAGLLIGYLAGAFKQKTPSR